MSSTEVHSPSRDAAAGNVDMHLEVEIIPVSDVDRCKQFYQRLGWRLDDDAAPLDGLRIVQFTPRSPEVLDHRTSVKLAAEHRSYRL
jgi:catechol 2,3-dioxygenase-like lactoylglutathione lyase family enzyme